MEDSGRGDDATYSMVGAEIMGESWAVKSTTGTATGRPDTDDAMVCGGVLDATVHAWRSEEVEILCTMFSVIALAEALRLIT